MNSQAEKVKEAVYTPDILAYGALSLLDAMLKCMAGWLVVLVLRLVLRLVLVESLCSWNVG